MDAPSTLSFREADSPGDLRQVHALNHRIFAEEIAQHPLQSSRLLVDRLQIQSRYFVAVQQDHVVGMISANPGPDFSVRRRLPDPGLLGDLRKPLEIRLLAIDSSSRNKTILGGLLWQIYAFASSQNYSHLLISGITEREAMYRKLGFQALGPGVAEGLASFIPMVMQLGDADAVRLNRVSFYKRRWDSYLRPKLRLSLLPGPVAVHTRVAQSYASTSVSHRCCSFTETFEEVRQHLRGLAPGLDVALFAGTGTLANDAVAANLRLLFDRSPGLIVSNGEFGERLVRQARAAGLNFRTLRFPWGETWALPLLEQEVARKPAWIWAVHLETSTGVLNDVETLLDHASNARAAVALDCVSSLGAVPIPSNNEALFFATSVSGKSLGAFTGLAIVYMSQQCRSDLADRSICPSFDLFQMQQTRGPISTVPSSAVFALAEALRLHYASRAAIEVRLEENLVLGKYVRKQLRAIGLNPLAAEEASAPNISTFVLPDSDFPTRCLDAGFEIAHQSSYLQARNWGQLATMGEVRTSTLSPLFYSLSRSLRH